MEPPSSMDGLPSPSRPTLVTRSLQFSTQHISPCDQPYRPNSTPTPRIQRLLLGPGQNVTQVWTHQEQLMAAPPSKLTRLPDSPPRLLFAGYMGSNDSQSSDDTCEIEPVSSPTDTNIDERKKDMLAADKRHNHRQSHSANNSHGSLLLDNSTQSTNDEQKSDKHSKYDFQSSNQEFDVMNSNEVDSEISNLRIDMETNGSAKHEIGEGLDINVDDDEEYRQALLNRQRLLNDEANRQRIRHELESYVGSLNSLSDEDGEQLVQFPRNYQQVLSLMTQKDVCEEVAASKEGKPTRQNWSRVLIDSGLSKQQAFGIIEEVDNDLEESSILAAKIALKMARIRQLDTILEEKLGKNLYTDIVPRKQQRKEIKKRNSFSSLLSRTCAPSATPSVALTGGQTSRSTINIRHSNAIENEGALGAKKDNNFIERNKQIVANGMKANMTKQEEERLESLLRDDVSLCDGFSSEDSARLEGDTLSQERNEYTLTDAEKRAIDTLIATQSVNYPLYAIDELPLDDTAKDNIIQETKRERLQRQRLSRVEQELRFLHDCPSVVIVGDDRDVDEHDDCHSEQSYATATSSTCSTRSGVISRHDFKRFLAQQTETFQATPTASADTIRQLLATLNPEKLDVVSATTGLT